MSISPYFFDYDLPRRWPRRLLEQNFGHTLAPEDIFAATSPVVPRINRFWWPQDSSTIKVDKDKWSINIDVQHFAPDEITVKTVDGFIVVEGKHEEKQDEHGYVSRHFIRRFNLPQEINADAIISRLSSDGVLSVLAPKKEETQKGERSVPITHTGPIRKEVTEDIKEEKKE